jgi:hypothetical protein
MQTETSHTLQREDFGAHFTFTVYDQAGNFMQAFTCQLDPEDGGWYCEDTEFSCLEMIYAEIAEQAQCEFKELGIQRGNYDDLDGLSYFWTISAV